MLAFAECWWVHRVGAPGSEGEIPLSDGEILQMTHLHVYKPFFCLRTTRNILDSSMNTSHATGYYQLPLNNLPLFLFSFPLSQFYSKW